MPTPKIDAARLALYRENLMPWTCVLCFHRWDEAEDATATPTALTPPAEYPVDLATIIAGFCREDGMARLCPPCALLAEHAGNTAALRHFLRAKLHESPWFQSLGGAEQDGTSGLFVVVLYAWLRSNRASDTGAPPAGLAFTLELCRTYPMLPPPADREEHGALEVFSRDVGLGCYLSVAPFDSDEVLWMDFASKVKHKGNGGITFRKLLALADACHATVVGVIEAHGKWGGRRDALSRSQLLRWYTRLDFEAVGQNPHGDIAVRREPRA